MTMTNKVTYDTVCALAQSVCDMLQHNDVHWRWFREEMYKLTAVHTFTEDDMRALAEVSAGRDYASDDQLQEEIDDLKDTISDLNKTIRERDCEIDELETERDQLQQYIHDRT
jgi:chromosome segregation ATPase